MIEELRSIARPGLQEALGWVGFRVDDIYGANVGKLEDVWVDPASGAPRWLLVRSGRFGGNHRLIPAEDATAGAGHIWVPFERDTVRHAPGISPTETLSQDLDQRLRSHYATARAGVAAESPAAAPHPVRQLGRSLPRAVAVAHPSPVALSRVRTERRRETQRTDPLTRLATQLENASVRIEGVGEVDGKEVDVLLEGRFTGTISPRPQTSRPRRRSRAHEVAGS